MYTDPKIQESIRKVEAARAENVKLSPARMSAEEKENLLKTFHPDYRENQFTTLRIGPNKGGKVPREVGSAAMRIQYHNSMVLSAKIPLNLYSSSTMQEDKNAMRLKRITQEQRSCSSRSFAWETPTP